MVDFIDDHRRVYGVEPICRIVPIAPSTYYDAKTQQADATRRSVRAQRDTAVSEATQDPSRPMPLISLCLSALMLQHERLIGQLLEFTIQERQADE